MAEIDFDDEDAVLAEMAHELDIDPDELKIKSSRGLEGFGTGTVYEITIRGHGGPHKEWSVVADDDQAEKLAIEVVKQDLEEEPENFNKSFIEQHINTDRLRRDLHSDVYDMRQEDLANDAQRDPERFWDEYERAGFDVPEEDEEGNRPEPEDSDIESLAEHQTEERLKDPMAYLEDIYGDEAAKKAIEIAGIDIDAAASEAVSADGPGHFLRTYDGNTYETENGLVYWRVN
jgi:hypothetical protein